MMPLLYPLELAAVIVLGFLLWKQGADRTIAQNRRARILALVGLVIIGLNAALYLLFAIGESVSGDISGLAHLVPFALAALLAFLAWKRPLDGGIALIILGILGTILSPPISARGYYWNRFYADLLQRAAHPGGAVFPGCRAIHQAEQRCPASLS